MQGENSFVSSLDKGVAINTDNVAIFDGNDSTHVVLTYPIYTSKLSSGVPNSGK